MKPMKMIPVVWDKSKGRPKWLGWRVVLDDMLVKEGMLIPRWYGVAWREFDRDCSVVMPVPLNLIAGWTRRLWHWLRWGFAKRSVLDEVAWVAYERGREDRAKSNLKARDSREEWVRQAAYDAGRRDTMNAL